jgi:hypothetical protein
MARGQLSESWSVELIAQTRALPADLREATDQILVQAAAPP